MSTFWQVPAVAGVLLHVWQAGQPGTTQHTPSVQALLAHSALAKQSWPSGLGPHELLALQTLGAQQSAAPLQVTTHAVPLHREDPQPVVAGVGALHTPAPSQLFAKVSVEVEVAAASAHVWAAHSVPAGHRRQAPFPSQKPSVWQLEASVFVHCAEGPTATGLHVPSEPATAHDWHAPPQAELQQKPWAQVFETHSVPSPHAWPFALRPHSPVVPLQMFGAAQSATVVAAVQLPLHTAPPHL